MPAALPRTVYPQDGTNKPTITPLPFKKLTTTAWLSHGNMFVLPAHKRGRGEAETQGPTGDYLLNTYRCVSFNGCLLSGRLG